MEDPKRLLITIIAATGFLWVWMTFFGPKPPQKSAVEITPPTTTSPTQQAVTPPPQVSSTTMIDVSKVVTRETQNSTLKMKWSNVEGTPVGISLLKYRRTIQKDSSTVEMIPFLGEQTTHWIWSFEMDEKTYSDEGVIYKEIAHQSNQMVYERELTPQVHVRKTYSWKDDPYTIELLIEVLNSSATPKKVQAKTQLSASLATHKAAGAFDAGDPMHINTYLNDETFLLSPEDIVKNKPFPMGEIRWAGIDSRYFLLSLIPTQAKWSELETLPVWKDLNGEKKIENLQSFKLNYKYPSRDLAAKSSQQYGLRLYSGPKDIELLHATEPTLDRAIDLGNWLGPIARPILKLLRFLHSLIPNFGIAIILLTVLVRLLMFPLAQMQAKSMKKMTEHKPQMDAIREKFKEQKDIQSKELMNYMRHNRINPMGGCLLLLPQLPIFFALYRVIYNSIELRQAPFILWFHDLSVRDPYFILPVLLGAVMFYQQKITPTPGVDPAQQKMMKFMPVMFSVFMISLPAGLCLYIFVSTLWGIGQQLWVTKSSNTLATK